MAKKRISKERRIPGFSDLPIVKLKGKSVLFNATERLLDRKKTWQALAQAMEEGDHEAFIDILQGYVESVGLAKVHKQTGLQKSTIQKAIRPGANPTVVTVMKLLKVP